MEKKLDLLAYNLYQLGHLSEAYMLSKLGLSKFGSSRGGHSRESLGATLPWKEQVWGHWEWTPTEWWGYKYVIEDRRAERFGRYAPGMPEKDFRVLIVFTNRDAYVENILNESPEVAQAVTRANDRGYSILGEYDTFTEAADRVLLSASNLYIDILTDPNEQFNFTAKRDFKSLNHTLQISIDRELENRGISLVEEDLPIEE